MNAFLELDGSVFQGRLLHVLPGKTAPTPGEEEKEGQGAEGGEGDKKEEDMSKVLTYKQQMAIKRKKEASTMQHTWNSLFMRVRPPLLSYD